MTFKIITPNWPQPKNIRALASTRLGGQSLPPLDSLNFGLHVNDHPAHVLENRAQFIETYRLPHVPEWLEQTHSTTCVVVENTPNRNADASITRSDAHCLAIMTADCLPILLCDTKGQEIAAIHAGWRGLANGIIEETLLQMHTPATNIMAWLGPSICGECYEVGEDVYNVFHSRYTLPKNCFKPSNDKWLANKPVIATHILSTLGVKLIFPSQQCTFEDEKHFYSYRRDGQTGRMGTFIWIEEN